MTDIIAGLLITLVVAMPTVKIRDHTGIVRMEIKGPFSTIAEKLGGDMHDSN